MCSRFPRVLIVNRFHQLKLISGLSRFLEAKPAQGCAWPLCDSLFFCNLPEVFWSLWTYTKLLASLSERTQSSNAHLYGFVSAVGWPTESYLNLHCLPVSLLNTRASVKSPFICNKPCNRMSRFECIFTQAIRWWWIALHTSILHQIRRLLLLLKTSSNFQPRKACWLYFRFLPRQLLQWNAAATVKR